MVHLAEALVQFQSGMSSKTSVATSRTFSPNTPRPTMTPAAPTQAGVPYNTPHPYPNSLAYPKKLNRVSGPRP